MKEFFARLNPMERRFVVGVAVLFFIVVNFFWVWPHFSDWGATKARMAKARDTLVKYEAATQKVPKLEKQVADLAGMGLEVPQEDQSIQFARTIQNTAMQSGVGVLSSGNTRQAGGTNQFFLEQIQTINVQAHENQLVDFLYNLGVGGSLIRVRDLAVQPDPAHMQLNAHVTLIASYQKNPAAKAAATPVEKPAPATAKPAPKPAPAPAPAKPAVAPQPSTPKKK